MVALPVEVLLGVYLGLLTGVVPALISGGLGFVFKYFTGVTVPGLGVVALAVAIAGVNGGLLGLIDPSVSASPRLMIALVVVMMLSLYAHSQGDRLGAKLPRRVSFNALRQRTLSTDVINVVGGLRRVTVRADGEIEDLEGYPPLPEPIRATLRDGVWEFPADLPLTEIERRLADRLRTAHDLADVSVSIDHGGRATIAAAPPSGAISRRVSDNEVAVSVDALVPAGMARGERITVHTEAGSATGTLVSAGTDGTEVATDGGEDAPAPPPTAPRTSGGEGRITISVPRSDARRLLDATRGRVLVHPRGGDPAFALIAALRRGGGRVDRFLVREDGPLDGTRVDEVSAIADDHLGVLAVEEHVERTPPGRLHRLAVGLGSSLPGGRHLLDGDDGRVWRFAPADDRQLMAGEVVYVAGQPSTLDRLQEAGA